MEESTSQPGSLPNQLIGQRIGSYRVLDTLGSGGMSTVYRAIHLETGHEVALKVLLGSLSRSSNLLQRFLREARSAETLEHSHIATIYDRGVDQGRHYLVLEYVAGGDFHDYVQRNGPLGVEEAVSVVRGVASGLRYAAGRGLIHRDIKPSNILRTPKGVPKIIDLGLALQSEFEDERVTREGTTVGTVDYMSPEQARDSRATSIQSDMYSLGCTFYYLLAGIPPFPGGDITEKLTRHARAPAPDIRDLRPEIPAGVAALLLRMMAKQPEDRYADYDQLIAALDAAGRAPEAESETIALAPLDGEESEDWPTPGPHPGPARGEAASGREGPEDDVGPMLLEPLNGLSLELADEREPAGPRSAGARPEAPIPRLGSRPTPDLGDESEEDAVVLASPTGEAFPMWLLNTAAAAVLAVLLVVGLHAILGGPGVPDRSQVESPEPEVEPSLLVPRQGGPRGTPPALERERAGGVTPKPTTTPVRPPVTPVPDWVEPEDTDRVAGDPGPIPPALAENRRHLPDWTRTPAAPPHPEDAFVVVRRVADATDGTTVATLLYALDRYRSGIVEVADDGPLPVDDIHISGESRVVRARRGYRPIIRIQRSRPGPALDQSAFFPLDRKNLTLEGLDFIVDARDLSGKQTALFGCAGSSLTLRDCTITVLNPTGAPFTLIRQEPSPKQDRPSRIHLERTLVRGAALTAVNLTGGPADLVIDSTAIIAGEIDPPASRFPGSGPTVVRPPVVRVSRAGGSDEQRIFLANALIACPGPVIRCHQLDGAPAPARPLAIRADGSAFGRLVGPAIASIIASTDQKTPTVRQVSWAGDRNLFAGWMGIFARGPVAAPKIVVDDLLAARSTWNAGEQGSQWIIPGWQVDGDPVRQLAREMLRFLPGWDAPLSLPARPAAGLFLKTIEAYPDPVVPEPLISIASVQGGAVPVRTGPDGIRQQPIGAGSKAASGRPVGSPDPSTASAPLVMNTADPPWNGDLGAFLHDRISAGDRHVRVRVVGSGTHRFTAVRLPDGITLEIQVAADPRGDGRIPSWSPDPQATGPGLIELRGGALVLSDFHLRHEPGSRLESLLSLEDSHLVLLRCELTVPPNAGAAAGDLVVFRGAKTRSMAGHPANAVFQIPVDRPVCRLIDTVLIANRTALRAELGRGLVALSGCAVASDETAIELDPARVARHSLDADLWLDRCTLVAARSIVGLGHWPGVPAGPDRPWLIQSRRSAFFTLADLRSRGAVLLRVDSDAFAGGCVFWQADGDAYELDRVVSAGELPAVPSRRDEVSFQWDFLFWPSNHATRTVTGPRALVPRFQRRPRPGRIEPSDLVLESSTAGRRGALEVGADLPGVGLGPLSTPPTRRPN